MSAPGGRRLVGPALWMVAPVVLVLALRPWTIRSIEERRAAAFDSTTYAASAWPRVLREAAQTATEWPELANQGGALPARARFVKGTGVVDVIDRRSRVGVMRVRLSSATPAMMGIQIGPVIRGTALRDASSFIRFSDFTNQFDFAGAANALNDHVLRTVLGAMPVDTYVGRTITFVGAIGKSPLRDDGAVELVPVQLELVGAAGK